MPKELQQSGSNDASPETYIPVSKPARILRRGRRVASSADVYEAMLDIRGADCEHLVAFYLDARHRLISREIVHIGTLTGVETHPREIFRPAVTVAAAALVVSHNHPSGDPSPSQQDIDLTTRLRDAGRLLGIPLLDHVVVAADGYTSLAERGWL